MSTVTPFSLKDAPSLIERLLPVQKLSAEAYKENMANVGKTLTALGSYWKGRKALILNKACILGCLLPATDDPKRDLEIFEKLMAMDDESFVARWPRRPKPREILADLNIPCIADYFVSDPPMLLPLSAPVDWSKPELLGVKVQWRDDITELKLRQLEAQMLPKGPYRARVDKAKRPEEVVDIVHAHIWEMVNAHLHTSANSFPKLVEQLGVMRFGHRPRVGDTFSGSGQIPFEAARLGCDVYASDLNPIACMLTWGAFHIVGGSPDSRAELERKQRQVIETVQSEIDRLGVETDGSEWRAKTFLYCLEVRCPQSGWMVPLIPSLVISKGKMVVIDLLPDAENKRYAIKLRTASLKEVEKSNKGTIRTDGRGQDPYLIHIVNGIEYRTKISTLRGDFRSPDGNTSNELRMWDKSDFEPRLDDIFRDRLYAIQWIRPKKKGKSFDYEFRSVTEEDMRREDIVREFVGKHLCDWQKNGWLPDMRIEPGAETTRLSRERGWTHWHHLFNPRQLMVNGLINRLAVTADLKFGVSQAANWNSKLSLWNNAPGGDSVNNTFYNQALNTLSNHGTRASHYLANQVQMETKSFPLKDVSMEIRCHPSDSLDSKCELFITDPPYGDAVNYDEILEYFIAWLRKNPPPEFADWVWDSRRSLAIKGGGEDFRRRMVDAYKIMTKCMPDNGLQVIMFTHQSGSIWADMSNIVWAAGLQVTAAWYVVTETDNPLREGSYVKGTVLLICRKRSGTHKTTRDDLAWEIQEEVEKQIHDLTGLNQEAKGLYRDENVFEDADIQMAGYAAALRVLTRYAVIDGRDMTAEAIRPRVKGETTFVDGLIEFAVDTANQCLVPQGIDERHWKEFSGVERFYLKLIDLEAKGFKTLDNYQNFAKAFKVRDFRALMGNQKANEARLKSAAEFAKSEMSEGAELHDTVLRAVLYAIMELAKETDGSEVLAHLTLNVPDYYADMTRRERVVEIADYLARHLETLRPEEASAARVLRELVKNQRLG
jgi:putative DNA methylase